MKKTYIQPASDLLDLKTENLMEQVIATSVSDGEKTDPIKKDEGEDAWAGAKGYNAWNTWEDEE